MGGVSRAGRQAPVILGWGLAGAVGGVAAALALVPSGKLLLPAAMVGGVSGGIAGVWAERQGDDRVLVGDREDRVRPAWVLWVPVALALPSLTWVAMVLTVVAGSTIPVWVLGGLGLGIGLAAVRAHRRGRLARTVAALESGREGARARLEGLASGAGAEADSARYVLALDDLRSGELAAAAGRLTLVERSGGSAGSAAAALAFVRLLQGREDDAMAAVRRALQSGGPAVQAQTDAVRVLHVWRAEGAEPALDLGERVLGGASSLLLVGLVAALRRATGDADGAEALATPELRAALVRAGWTEHVTELAGLTSE
ncbi:MAG: hypothetical protein ACI8PZ_002201 [Myxococcota bacterium]